MDIVTSVIENPELLLAVTKPLISKVKQIIDKKKEDDNDDENVLYEQLKMTIENYIAEKYLEFSYIKPLALSGDRVKLKELYYPLTLVTRDRYCNEDSKELNITKFTMELFKNSSRILIEDNAGMGKSTLMKFLFLSYIEEVSDASEQYIPIFLEVRNLQDGETIESLIRKHFFVTKENVNLDIVKKLLEQNIIFFLDGFDEISDCNKSSAIEQIKQITNSKDNNLYILSSRPEGELSSFSNYMKYQIKPLRINEATKLIKNYISNDEDILELTKQIRLHKSILSDFLRTPLLASLLCRAFFYKKHIPETKLDYYTQVFDALYETHDISSKQGYVRQIELTKIDFQKLLEEFSFLNIGSLKIQFTESEMIEKLEKIKSIANLSYDISTILKNLLKEVPLFRKEGNNYFWSHKSMQEFFIALKISKIGNKKYDFIKQLITSDKNRRYINILEFLYDLETIIFQSVFLKEIIESTNSFKDVTPNLSEIEREHVYMYPDVYSTKFKFECEDKLENIHNKISDLNDHINFHNDLPESWIVTTSLHNNERVYTKFSTSKFYFILKFINDRKVDIFKKNVLDVKDLKKLELMKFNKDYYRNKDKLEYFQLLKNRLQYDLRDFILLDYEKIVKLYDSVNKKRERVVQSIDSLIETL